MSTFRRARPSAALVVAIIALFVAMGGSAYAGFSVPRNSVGSKQLKKNAVTKKKIAGSAVTGAKIANGTITGGKIRLSTLGTVPSANTANTATSATHASTADDATNVGGKPIRWVLVDKTGSIVEQSGGFTVTSHPAAGNYVIGAGSTVTGHAIIASDGFASDTSKRGVTVAGPCGTGPDGIDCSGLSPAGLNDGTHIFVGTTATNNSATADHSFYLMLY
jgi:hypothetical protein